MLTTVSSSGATTGRLRQAHRQTHNRELGAQRPEMPDLVQAMVVATRVALAENFDAGFHSLASQRRCLSRLKAIVRLTYEVCGAGFGSWEVMGRLRGSP